MFIWIQVFLFCTPGNSINIRRFKKRATVFFKGHRVLEDSMKAARFFDTSAFKQLYT